MEIEEIRIKLHRILASLDHRRKSIDEATEKFEAFLEYLDELDQEALEKLEEMANEEITDDPTEAKTHFELISQYLRQDPVIPMTIANLEKATGIGRQSISAVIYRTHANQFVRYDLPNSRAKGWLLKGQEPVDRGPDYTKSEDDVPF